jgi:expansin (peptidoglycan-binding protein)
MLSDPASNLLRMLLLLAGALRAFLALVAALAMATSGGPLATSNDSGASRSQTTGGRGTAAAASGATAPRAGASAPVTSATTRLGAAVQGQATHYGPAQPGGNCMFPSVPANKYTVAAGPDLYARGAACGGYLAVTSGGHTIRLKIDNQCPECGPGHIDLTDEAFAALAPLGRGLIPISYRIVTNPPLTSGLSFVVKTGSSRYWMGLLVDGAGNRLQSVQVLAGGRWQALSRTDYGYWLANSGAGTSPFTVRVTDVVGHRAVVTGIRLAPGAVQRTSVRLY